MEGCSKTEIIKFQKVGCLQAQFGLGAASGPRDFKSRVSTNSTIAAVFNNIAHFEFTVKPIADPD